ncbi:MAG: RIP metalloprotease RseP [Candidatus Magasanikbacteria bacterium CG11_big_fil_rev_8_21_14_0_20_43_7]|uniref:Zinc metalloprotease n=1 Tax=Candidatus Magasanikbacteria bacterium CG11_big_fil_rev_8_21_14_0_20_43_7 TaxID=1974654 RepID=A0A2H0N4S2_9BACT|nr:MAG: RIP metalloprotease RseP [Candidatus Magasanikbacteria bacterium CG11_big_fil_rev_8_21_14_0_20_43_7]
MVTVVLFMFILALLVLVHEWGHFIVARKSGMKVYEFGFGFPPRAFGFYRDPKTGKWMFVRGKGKNTMKETVGGEDREHPDEFPATLYSVNWLPLGGFVKIKGENGEAVHDPDSFGAKKFWQKALTLVAGVSMNIVLAMVLLSIGFMIGLPADKSVFDDPHAIVVEEPSVIAQQIAPNSPAATAGVKYGDKITAISGVPVITIEDLISYVETNPQEEAQLTIERNGEDVVLSITPEVLSEEDATPRLGIILADAGVVRYPWYIAIWKGIVGALIGTIHIFVAFVLLIKGLILGQGLAFAVAGPIGIAVVVGESARLGIAHLINVTAMLSLSLAVINILPIPALDGGRLLFVAIERIFKKPVPLKYEQMAHTLGFVLLMVLIVVVTWRDIVGLL